MTRRQQAGYSTGAVQALYALATVALPELRARTKQRGSRTLSQLETRDTRQMPIDSHHHKSISQAMNVVDVCRSSRCVVSDIYLANQGSTRGNSDADS
jgi:hypothetical protein